MKLCVFFQCNSPRVWIHKSKRAAVTKKIVMTKNVGLEILYRNAYVSFCPKCLIKASMA